MLTPNHTVTPAPYKTRFVGDEIFSIVVFDENTQRQVIINNPMRVYWSGTGRTTIRAYNPEDTFSFDDDASGVQAVFYKDGSVAVPEDGAYSAIDFKPEG